MNNPRTNRSLKREEMHISMSKLYRENIFKKNRIISDDGALDRCLMSKNNKSLLLALSSDQEIYFNCDNEQIL